MYIPRPAKLLFTIDDGWNRYLEKHGDNVSLWTRLCVERMLACGTCSMGVRRYCCTSPGCTHSRFFYQSCRSKACSACGMKSTEQWIAEQQHVLTDCEWQHITFTVPGEFWPLIYHNRWLLAEMSRLAADVILETERRAGLLPGCFAVIHTWGRDLQWHPHIHLSTTAGGVTDSNTWKKMQFYARNVMPMWRYRITDLLRREYWRLDMPESLAAESRSRREWAHFADRHYCRKWNVQVSEVMDNATHVAMYFGSYLKKAAARHEPAGALRRS